ncbi:DUF4347 domain-containing protein, partial [Oceanimonas sp. MB9]|uniref:DUF4347 domain-containing protein n=1 Tax=Oceanimonas sp. MB9 TaxID=2588453 RepID=UPI0013F62515
MNTKHPHHSPRRQPLITALEPRILLDGAAVATAVDLATDVDHQDAAGHSQAPEQSVHFTALAPAQVRGADPALNQGRKEVAFVDTGVEGYQALVDGIGAGIEVRLLDAGQDGLAQLTAWAQQNDGYDTIYLLSHGAEGRLQLGNLTLDGVEAERRADELGTLGRALTADGDLLLYGCSVASGEGEAFVGRLASLTGADVAASDDLTGAADLGGDWDLEVSRGTIDTDGDGSRLGEGFTGLLGPAPGTIDWTGQSYTNGGYVYDPTVANIGGSGLDLTVTSEEGGGGTEGVQVDIGSGDDWYYDGSATPPGDGQILKLSTDFVGNTNITKVELASSDGTEFKLEQLLLGWDVSNAPGDITITGWRDGAEVATQLHSTGTNDYFYFEEGFAHKTITLNADFANIDAFSFSYAADGGSGVMYGLALDNLVISAAEGGNAAPSVSVADASLAYTEGSAATQIDGAATISDADGDAEWNGGTLSVQITGNAEAGDRLSIVDSDGDGTAITISGTNIFANGVDIGDLSTSGGIVTGGTQLTITFDADATNANVQEVLQSMRFDSTTDDPGTSSRTITFTATDKNAASGSDTRTVVITAINDEPALTATGSNPTFTEGGAAASLFSGTSINTVESGQNVTALSFTVTNVTDGSNERINVDGTTIVLTHGTNGSTAGNSLNYSVMVIGTTATVSLTGGNLSVVAAETMIDNMSYQNNSNAPSTSNRVVTLTSVQDSGGTANGGDNTGALAVASTVTVVQNNDEPTLTSNGSHPTFTEGGAAGSLFNGTSISTVESGQTLTGFSFTVSNVTDGSSEVINLDGTAIVLTQGTSGSTAGNSLGYTVTVVGTTATVSLTGGTLSTATVQTLIDNMSYQNNSDAPDTSNRVVTLTSLQDSGGVANGGDDTASLAVASTVTVVGVNDEPALTANASHPTFTEGGAAASLFSGTSINTVESGQNVTGLSFTVTNVTDGSNERINVDGTTIVLTHGT